MVKIIFSKADNGSTDWKAWDGSIKHKWLYSAGPAYVRTVRSRSGRWTIQYRLGKAGLQLPDLFKKKYTTEEAVSQAVREFAEWAFRKRPSIIEAHERSCDSIHE